MVQREEGFPTVLTIERLIVKVQFFMHLQMTVIRESFPTLFAHMELPISVSFFHVSEGNKTTGRFSHTAYTHRASRQCGFSRVSSVTSKK